MDPKFKAWMARATELTQTGQLQEATAALMSALGAQTAVPVAEKAAKAVAPAGDVIDVEARVVQGHDVADDVVQADAPPVRPAARPATSHAAGQFLTGTHTEAGLSRDYKLFVPPQAAEPGRALPLVVMLHGCTQNPDDFAAGTRMNELALAQGFLVLYPAQAKQANTSGCWNWFKHNHQARGKGEPAVIAGMVRAVMAQQPVDARRVFVAGLSAGGAMAAILGAGYPELFAAIGVHSGLPVGAARDVSSAFMAMSQGAQPSGRPAPLPPVIVFHGDQDTTVNPVNGQQVIAASVQGRATAVTETGRTGRPYQRQVYRDASGRTLAEHWLVQGAGHAWSGGSAKGSYADAAGPDASAEMLRFFMASVR